MRVIVRETDSSEKVPDEPLSVFSTVRGPAVSVAHTTQKLSTRQKFRMRRARRLFHKRLSQYEGLPNVKATRDAISREIQRIKPQTDKLLFG